MHGGTLKRFNAVAEECLAAAGEWQQAECPVAVRTARASFIEAIGVDLARARSVAKEAAPLQRHDPEHDLIHQCEACGARNRVPKGEAVLRCGRCKESLTVAMAPCR